MLGYDCMLRSRDTQGTERRFLRSLLSFFYVAIRLEYLYLAMSGATVMRFCVTLSASGLTYSWIAESTRARR